MKIGGPTFHRCFFFSLLSQTQQSLVNDGLTTGGEEAWRCAVAKTLFTPVNTAHKPNLFFKYRSFTSSFILNSNQHLCLTLHPPPPQLPSFISWAWAGQGKPMALFCLSQKLRYVSLSDFSSVILKFNLCTLKQMLSEPLNLEYSGDFKRVSAGHVELKKIFLIKKRFHF